MIKNISIVHFRKLRGLNLEFSPRINIISGPNGTCKSSLLYIISNSYKAVVAKNAGLKDKDCLTIVKAINAGVNLKMESLIKDAKEYEDPAAETKGNLYNVTYINDMTISFRKHNSTTAGRFAIKPQYKTTGNDQLPEALVLYLGLARLCPIGEYSKDEKIEQVVHALPDSYKQELREQYKNLTNITIDTFQSQRMGDVKVRNDFTTKQNGIDGNTISSGEDNLFIILTALYSLKYYYECLPESTREIESILLIDELDATLHPSLQERLLNLIRDFSSQYKIQFISTTHSLFLLEECLRAKDNVIYLQNNIETVKKMQEPDIMKIQMNLKTTTRQKLFANRKILIFTEDKEARTILKHYMDYLAIEDSNFRSVQNCFEFVEAQIGGEALKSLFSNINVSKSLNAICILDGDKTNKQKSPTVFSLPGGDSPEKVIFTYANELFHDANCDFWNLPEVEYAGYDRNYYHERISMQYDKYINENAHKKQQQQSHKGKLREKLKKLWNEHEEFLEFVIKHWFTNKKNEPAIKQFTKQLQIAFYKTSEYRGIPGSIWPKVNDGENQNV